MQYNFQFVRVVVIETTYQPWEGRILPLNYTRPVVEFGIKKFLSKFHHNYLIN